MSLALEKIKVLEIGTLIAAPFATRILAEFGAEVIKIEPIGKGDPLRKWRKLHHGTSLWWYLQSRNKKSLALNLKSPEAIALIKKIKAEGGKVDGVGIQGHWRLTSPSIEEIEKSILEYSALGVKVA
ncbi:MAG: CoA transferase, partial [Acinetobacter pittii]